MPRRNQDMGNRVPRHREPKQTRRGVPSDSAIEVYVAALRVWGQEV